MLRQFVDQHKIKGFEDPQCTLVLREDQAPQKTRNSLRTPNPARFSIIGSYDCEELTRLKLRGGYIATLNHPQKISIAKVKSYKKVDPNSPLNKNKILHKLLPRDYKIVIKRTNTGKPQPAPEPHPLSKHMKKMFIDVDVHGSDQFNEFTSKQFSSEGKNLLEIKIQKATMQNNMKIVLYNGKNPEKIKNHYFWIEWQESDKLTIFNLRTRKYLETRTILNDRESGHPEILFGEHLLVVWIYICSETNNLVVLRKDGRSVLEATAGVFEDDDIRFVKEVDFYKLDTYGVQVIGFDTFRARIPRLEELAQLKSRLSHRNSTKIEF